MRPYACSRMAGSGSYALVTDPDADAAEHPTATGRSPGGIEDTPRDLDGSSSVSDVTWLTPMTERPSAPYSLAAYQSGLTQLVELTVLGEAVGTTYQVPLNSATRPLLFSA